MIAPRCPKVLIAVALLPILEPIALTAALGEGSPTLGAVATGWLSLATGIRWIVCGIGGISLLLVVRHAAGHIQLPHPRRWALLAIGIFFSLVSVATLYPVGARQVAKQRAERAADEVAAAIRQYRRKHDRLPADLNALVPLFLPASPIPGIAGSTIQYNVESSDYTLTIPCPGDSVPFVYREGTGTYLGDMLRTRRLANDR